MGITSKMAVERKLELTDLEMILNSPPSHPNSLALFAMAVKTELGNGNNTLFWTDKWIHGGSVENIALLVLQVYH